ncbi:MAG: hypothetical protein ACREUD_03845 [Gammaproteobacteria bacterium]
MTHGALCEAASNELAFIDQDGGQGSQDFQHDIIDGVALALRLSGEIHGRFDPIEMDAVGPKNLSRWKSLGR